MIGYVIENTLSQFDQKEKVHKHYTLVKHYLGEPLLLDAAQCGSYLGQPYTILSSTASFEIHHQRPQPVGFSHIG
jgi:hypothetical protein